jgi:rhodanese-related sulfurtransferase
MSAAARPTGCARPPFAVHLVVLEAVVIVVAGLILGLFANVFSPRGLKLGRDYFPKLPLPTAAALASESVLPSSSPPAINAVRARLRERGLQPLEHAAVVALFHDRQQSQGMVIFVDARNDAHYEAGHIPGAHQFDYYRPEVYLPAVLAACATAEKIVVYCTGGDCEDSELAAILLTQSGVPSERVYIYPGGFAEWSANRLPVELGAGPGGGRKDGPP